MNYSSPAPRRLSAHETLKGLAAGYLAAIVALVIAIWFELPSWLRPALLVLAIVLALLTAISASRTLADYYASLPYRKRPALTSRSAGALTFVLSSLIAIACAYFVYPRSWPTSVDDAVAELMEELDSSTQREIAYMSYDDLARLQSTLGASLREQFGLNQRNFRLAHDCDAEYMNPHTCSSIVLSRLWKKLREELPGPERAALERLETSMERVRLDSKEFHDVPLEQFAAALNDAIRAQLPEHAELAIVHDAALAPTRLSTSWHAMGTISLREALALLEEGGDWRVRKDPPNLVVEPVKNTQALPTRHRAL